MVETGVEALKKCGAEGRREEVRTITVKKKTARKAICESGRIEKTKEKTEKRWKKDGKKMEKQ